MKNGFVVLLISGCAGFLMAGCGSSQQATQTTTAAPVNLGPTLTLPTPTASTNTATAAATPPPVKRHRASHGSRKPASATKHSSSGSRGGSSGSSGYSGAQGSSGSSGSSTPASSGASSAGGTTKSSSPPPVHTVTVIHKVIVYKTRIKTRTKTKTKTNTQTVTVTKTVKAPPPAVPQGAFPPSRHAPKRLGAFRADDGTIGCRLAGGQARCDIASRTWTPPAKPPSCSLAWGQGLAVGPSGPAHFVCAGDTALDPGGPVVADGADDVVGSLTCQARKVGVTCFDQGGNGFFIGPTGYTTF